LRILHGIPITEDNRFSEFVRPSDKAGREALEAWRLSFARAGITSVITITDKGFALYRLGLIR
jgi:hypothetical protein